MDIEGVHGTIVTTYPNTFYYPETHETLNLKSKT